jgi:hypothetical protein
MKNKWFFSAAAFPALLFLALGCGTSAKSTRWEDVGIGHKTLAEGDVKVSARYLDMNALRALHKTTNNPFTEWPASVFVVDVTVESGAPVDVRAGEAVLAKAGGPQKPVAKEDLKSLWHSTLENNRSSKSSGPSRYSGWSYPYVRDLIDETVLPAAAAVSAGGKVSGYLLFPRAHKDSGPATFRIPVLDGGASRPASSASRSTSDTSRPGEGCPRIVLKRDA